MAIVFDLQDRLNEPQRLQCLIEAPCGIVRNMPTNFRNFFQLLFAFWVFFLRCKPKGVIGISLGIIIDRVKAYQRRFIETSFFNSVGIGHIE